MIGLQYQKIDVGVGMQFAPPVSSDGDEGESWAIRRESLP